MKKVIVVLGCFIVLVSSCKTSNSVVSNGMFQKRKYTKGYHVNKSSSVKTKKSKEDAKEYHYSELKNRNNTEEQSKSVNENLFVSDTKGVISSKNKYSDVFKAKKENEKVVPKQEDCGDKVILKNGDEIDAKIISVGVGEITYKKCSNIDGPTYTIAKKEVFMVKYKNGEKDVFNTSTLADDSNDRKDKSSPAESVEPLAIASMSSGILGLLLLFWFGVFGVVLALAAIIFGIISLSKLKNNEGAYSKSSKSFAWIGLILGILSMLLLMAVWFEFFYFY